MNIKRPKILTDAGYEIYCDTVKLRDADLPVVDFDVEKLVWNLDMPFWEKDGTDDWNLTPRDVMNKIEGSSEHQERVKKADLQYPIFVIKKKGRWLIIDGVHRLVKALQSGHKTIKAKIVTPELIRRGQAP